MRSVVGSSDEKAHLQESRNQPVASSVQFVSAAGTGVLRCLIFKAGKKKQKKAKVAIDDDDKDVPNDEEQATFDAAVKRALVVDDAVVDEAQVVDEQRLDSMLKVVTFADVSSFNDMSKRGGGFLKTVVYFTESGCANNRMLGDVFNLFVQTYKGLVGNEDDSEAGVNALVFLDNLGAHKAGKARRAILDAAGQSVHFRFLPANGTHVYQPLDHGIFGAQKRLVALLARRRQRHLVMTGRAAAHLVVPLLRRAQQRAVTPAVIQGAFKRAFIWPWAPDEFLAAVLKNNGVVDATPSKQPNPVLAAVVEDVRRVVAKELQVARREPDVHVMRAKVKKEVRYSTFDLARLAADTEREEAEAAAAKA